MRSFYKMFAFALVLGLLLAACGAPAAAPARTEAPVQTEAPAVTLKIAVLPIIDALPMYVAQQEGLFEKNGVKVELIPVASAPEREQLLAAGQADGTINETLAVMLANREKIQMQAVRYALVPAEGHGHFFIIASAKSGITDPQGLKGVEIGVSQGTVIEYVTERLLQAQGFSKDEIKTIAVPKIPDRMALLASGELNAGTLPDPLGALAVQQGAKIILDDANYPQYGFSVISFRKAVIDENPAAVKGFLAAIEEAVKTLNADPKKYANLLAEQKLVPPPLMESYVAPVYPAAGIPSEAEWNDALAWAKEKGMLSADVSYADSVNSSLLP